MAYDFQGNTFSREISIKKQRTMGRNMADDFASSEIKRKPTRSASRKSVKVAPELQKNQ